MGVSPRNPYLFGTPNLVSNNYNYFRASSVLNHIARQSGVEHPDRIKATELRKHVATYAAQMQLSDFEVAETARFLGHTERIHRDIYRQPLIVRDIVHMSKFLEAALGEGKESTNNKSSNSRHPNVENSLDKGGCGVEHLDAVELPEISNNSIIEAATRPTSSIPVNNEVQRLLGEKKSKKPYEPWTQDEIDLLLSRWKSAMLRKGGKFPSDDVLRDFIEDNRNIFKSTRAVNTTRSFMHKFINSKHVKNL